MSTVPDLYDFFLSNEADSKMYKVDSVKHIANSLNFIGRTVSLRRATVRKKVLSLVLD